MLDPKWRDKILIRNRTLLIRWRDLRRHYWRFYKATDRRTRYDGAALDAMFMIYCEDALMQKL